MTFSETNLKGSFLINFKPMTDDRGWFCRTYCEREFTQMGLSTSWVQANHSFSLNKGTVRGLHYQRNPFAEKKLVCCVSGSIYDVIVDLRKDSPTFLKWFGVELSSENNNALYIPEGFAHGFQTLDNNTSVIYQHSNYYSPESEAGLNYLDPRIKIDWKLPVSSISSKDLNRKFLTDSDISKLF